MASADAPEKETIATMNADLSDVDNPEKLGIGAVGDQDPEQEQEQEHEQEEEGEEDEEQENEIVSLSLELGDIIRIIAPSHREIHEHTFIIDYLTARKIKIIDTDTIAETILNIDATGNLTDESITNIELLSRSDEKGYARQNHLVVSTWIDIKFGGDLPTIITGLITNVEEDMIEIRTYPEDEMIYINFDYSGIPEDLPIEQITIRPPPANFGKDATNVLSTQELENIAAETGAAAQPGTGAEEGEEGSTGFSVSSRSERERARKQPVVGFGIGENATEQPSGLSPSTLDAPSSAIGAFLVPPTVVRDKLKSILLDADQIKIGDDLDVLVQVVDIPDENRRFNLDKQCDDLLDSLVSNIPASEKTRSALSNIQRMVERFKELRNRFSAFDQNGNPSIPQSKSILYKPLVESLMRMNKSLHWILPVVKSRKVIYDVPIDQQTAAEMDIEPRLIQDEREAEIELQQRWNDGGMSFSQYMTSMSSLHMTPFSKPKYQHDVIVTKQVSDNITAVIDNLDDLYSSIVQNDKINRRRFVIQKYNLGLTKLQPRNTRSGAKLSADFVNMTPNDKLEITGFITFPEPVIYYSRIMLPNTCILDKSNLNLQHAHYWEMLRQTMSISTHEIADLNTPLDMNSHHFLSHIKHFILDPALDEQEKYRKFLEIIVPKTRQIFDMMRRYIHGRLTLQDVLAYIEPFLVYQEDLNVKQYDEIVAFLFERVLEYKRNYATNYRKFTRLRAYKYHVRYLGVSFLYKLLVTGKMMDADVFKAYGLQDIQVRSGGSAGAPPGEMEGMDQRQRQQMRGRAYATGLTEQTEYNENLLTSSELISRMLAVDYAKLYMDAVAITTTELITPFDFNLVLGEQRAKLQNAGAMIGGATAGTGTGDDDSDAAAAAAAAAGAAATPGQQPNAGARRFNMVLAKNYPNEESVNEDNDSDMPIYFDKKYDITDYSFIENYRKKQETMTESDFKLFLVDELIKNKKLSMEDATTEASALLTGPGMREVKDGNYAVVEVEEFVEQGSGSGATAGQLFSDEHDLGQTETHFLYFKRDNGKWVRDSTIPSLIPSSDRNYFCNIDRDCVPLAIAASDQLMAQQGPGSGVELLSSTEGSAAIKKAFLDKMKGEFDVKYQVTRENFTDFVKRKFEYDLKNITRITEIQNKEFYKYNDKQYQMGFHSRVPKKSAIAGSDDADDDANAAFNDDIEAILSPMEPLKDKILSQTDFVKRQYDILQFVSSFTRKANEIMDEDPHWLYCIKSNAKLMPSFYETIAIAFIQSHGAVSSGGGGGGSSTSLSLNVVIDTICKERGTISDDGEAWVDKYSGSIIKRIEHITEEGFDDAGFRLITRDIIEADAGDDILKVAKPVAPGAGVAAGSAASVLAKYDSPNAKIINNIITTMTGYMGINLHEEREFIIQNTIGLLETSVPSEDAYKLRSEKAFREKGKHLPPYRDTFYQTLLLLTLSYLIVAIQCAIPTPKTRKTHAGCVRSFSGYPIDGEGDVSGMMYVACIAYKIKTSIEPWNTLKSFKKEGDILAKLKTLIDTLIITKAAIKERLQTKRDHNKQHGAAEAIPDELSINRWGGFLPPMKSLDNMPTPQNVASDFVNQMITDMKRGYFGQHEKLNVLETKCLYFGLSIQQMIHSVVKNSSPLLMNMASEPFLENACCNDPVDRRGQRTIDYFMAKAQNIHHHNKIIGFLEKTSREMAVLTRPSMIVDNRNTRFHYPEIPADFDEKTIYRAFIAYCRLNHSIAVQAAANSGNPVSVRPNPISAAIANSDIRDICPERPGDWNPKDIIDDKIRKLKQANNLFDKNSLERLLHVVNKQNMIDSQNTVSKQRAIEPMPFQRFRDAILHLNRKYEAADAKETAIRLRDDRRGRDNYDEDAEAGEGAGGATAEEAMSMLDRCVIPSELRVLLIANMDTRDISVQEDTQEMRDIKNYLQIKNKEMTSMVIDFLHQNAKQTKTKMKEIENIINTILSFEINKSNGVLMSSVDETTTKSIQFMKNSIHRLINVIPTIIMNGIDFDDTHIPKHWGFSDTHMKDIKGIISSHYSSLKTFYNDNVIKEVLRHVSEHVKEIKLMMDNTPFLAEIFFDEDADAKIAAMAAASAMAATSSSLVPKEVDIVVPESESGGRVPHSTRKNIFTTYSIFDREIVRHLYLFYFLSLLQTYIYLVVETPISIYQTEPMRVIRTSSSSSSSAAKRAPKAKLRRKDASSHSSGAIARASNRADDEDSEEDHVEPQSRLYSSDAVNERNTGTIDDMDVIMGNKKALGQRVCELLIVYLRILEKDKTAINFNLSAIKEKLTRVKDKEKDGVVERIGAMSVPERKLENLMKIHKMGIWSRGTSQTGIVIYDQDYYDEEREEMDKIAQKERLLGKRDYVTDMNREIYVLDALEEDRVAQEIERHELDMSGIPEDDDAGEDDAAFIHRHDDEGEGYEGGGGAAGGGGGYDGDGDGNE